ncbi:hypothetical protein FQN50_009800 [Emmonsiellopsis sp. PD_5]|nr:hypothetical protein FQN50_009800 [Emmonsiellopsis sp. PD_5]
MDTAIVTEAETSTKDMSTAMVHSVKPDQHKGETDAGSMEFMVAVLVPAISHCHQEDTATLKGSKSKRHVAWTRQRQTRRKSKRQNLKSQDRRLPGSPMQPVDDDGGESDVSGTSDPSGDSDEDYTASSDDRLHCEQRRRSRRPRSQSQVARAVGGHREIEREPRSVRSVAATERSVSSTSPTREGHQQCIRSSQVAPASGGAEQTLSPRLLSPQDISALVSAFAQKLLDLRRGSSMDAMRAADEVSRNPFDTECASDDETIGEPDMKRPRWTQEDDERLKDLKTRGWRWCGGH